jgi:hypothetical protein
MLFEGESPAKSALGMWRAVLPPVFDTPMELDEEDDDRDSDDGAEDAEAAAVVVLVLVLE